jgi:lipid II:glycine glycyltransferase (peptidoglycan interpeptide bridge formation enzyme)
MISVIERNSLDEKAYSELIRQAAPQPIYRNLNFLDAIAKHTNSKLHFVVSLENGCFNAVLPFCIYAGKFGSVINSLPFFGSHGGIISPQNSITLEKAVIDTLQVYAKKNDCIAITLIESLFEGKPQEIYKDFDHQDSRIGLYNEILFSNSTEEILKGFQSRARNGIRKATKSGIEVFESRSQESIEFLARVHFESMTSSGRKAKSKNFFFEFLSEIPEDNWVILEARLNEEQVASLLLLYTSDFVEYFTPVTLAEYKQMQPLSLLILHGFIFARDMRIGFWNWGGTWTSQTGVYEFKKQWNPKETRYNYYTSVLKQSILDIDPQDLMLAYPFFYVYPIEL